VQDVLCPEFREKSGREKRAGNGSDDGLGR
jgi:hypothetical protein